MNAYLFTHTHTQRQREKEKQRHTKRQMDKGGLVLWCVTGDQSPYITGVAHERTARKYKSKHGTEREKVSEI